MKPFPKIFRVNKIYSFKNNSNFNFDPKPHFKPKMRFLIFKIFDRNDIRFEVDHVWTMRGPSFANVKDKRVRKERPPGPEGYRRPPPPPSPVISKDPFQVI